MPFVVDASIVVSWLLPDETDPWADAAFDRLTSDPAVTPALWWFEIRNVILSAYRRRRIDRTTMRDVLAEASELKIQMDGLPVGAAVISLAERHGLTFYDASYLELAVRLACPIATLDRQLLKAAAAEGVTRVGFVQ